MPNLLSQRTEDAHARFLKELTSKRCVDRGIPYKIPAEHPDGKVKAAKDADRKPIVLARLRHYPATSKVGQPTYIPAQILRLDNLP